MDNAGVCNNPPSEIIPYPNVVLPKAPTSDSLSLVVSTVNNDSRNIEVSWTSVSANPGVSKYELYMPDNNQPIASSRRTSFDIPNLTVDDISFRVRAVNQCGKSEFTDWVDYTVPTKADYPEVIIGYNPED